jgi:HEAT repeat protein
MADKRIISYHLSRLQDKNVDVRLKAIHELGLLGDPETLEPLHEVFRSDPDPDVRKAAQDAGRAVFLKQREQNGA